MTELYERIAKRIAVLSEDPDGTLKGAGILPAKLPMELEAAPVKLANLVIDQDWGQLEALVQGLDQYPVTFPCVLVGFPEITWENMAGETVQKGQLMLRTVLAFDVWEDTRLSAGREAAVGERWAAAKALNGLLHGKDFREIGVERLVRTQSRQYALPGGIAVYETTYRATVWE